LNAHRVITGFVSLLLSGAAVAGTPVPLGLTLGSALGTSLGVTLGRVLGATALGFPLSAVLPVTGGGLLTVAAASLVAGILIVRRKKRH
jgi:hypothetical protein